MIDSDLNTLSNTASNPIFTVLNSVSVLATGTALAVGSITLTTIVTRTAPAAETVSQISCSGQNYAKFTLVLNTVIIDTKRNGPGRNVDFIFFQPLALISSDILDVKVEHFQTGEINDFEATVYGG